MLRESTLFNQFDLNWKKRKPNFKYSDFSNSLTVVIIRLLYVYGHANNHNLTFIIFFLKRWISGNDDANNRLRRIITNVVSAQKVWKTYFKFTFYLNLRLFTLGKAFFTLSPSVPKFDVINKYFVHTRDILIRLKLSND